MVEWKKTMIELPATIKGIKVDEWGESEIVFRVPHSHLKLISQVMGKGSKLLVLRIEEGAGVEKDRQGEGKGENRACGWEEQNNVRTGATGSGGRS